MVKLVYIISDLNKSLQFEWIADGLDKKKIKQYYILLNDHDSDFEQYLVKEGFYVKRLAISNKLKYIAALFQIIVQLLMIRPNIVHCHLYRASLLGGFASFLTAVKKRISTRHYASYNREYYPSAVKNDRFINLLSTHIIAISENVKQELLTHENVSEEKIVKIYHGLNFDLINKIDMHDISFLRHKYGIKEEGPVVGVISRYIHLKGIQYIIPAFKQLLQQYPNAQLILANASGNYSSEIKRMLEDAIPHSSYIEISFENNLFALYKIFDVFIHVPINSECEAFGQIYTEALASEIPSIFTLSGVASEFIRDKENAIVVPFKDSSSIYNGIKMLLTDDELKQRIIYRGKQDVTTLFDISKTIHDLESLYLS